MPFSDIVDTLLHNDVSGLPVVDESGALLGVVTEADLMSNEAYGPARRRPLALIGAYLSGHDPQWVRKAAGLTARELMTAAPMTASPDETVVSAAQRMLLSHRKRMPVVQDGRVVGIVTRHDLLKPFHRTDDDLATEVSERFTSPLQSPEHHHARVSVAGGVVTLDGEADTPMDVALLAAVASKVEGVVAVENHLRALHADPKL